MRYLHHDPACAEDSCNVDGELEFKYKGREVIAIIYSERGSNKPRVNVLGYVMQREEHSTEIERVSTAPERKDITKRLRSRGLEQEIDFL
jgi:hypothetical protein